MKKIHLLPLLFSFFFVQMSFGQRLDHEQGEILVQFESGVDGGRAISQMKPIGVEAGKEISAPFGVWLLRFDFTKTDERVFLEKIRRQKGVAHAQFNHFVERRATVPDDPGFPDQWYWQNTGQMGGTPDADVDADLAWDLTTGGTTFDGHEIVVCVIEGANRDHPDLEGNLWENKSEIPGDEIDNDLNGYVDDYEGWNVNTLTDAISPDQHGTAVSGVIGAKGDNGTLLSGINWDVKIMHVDFSNSTESNIVAAYTYPLVMRRKFNETGGEEGALVVATNASWGIDGADPADYPIWCAIYDTLGAAGILNCVATTNDNVNVDDVGDMPGNCPSGHLLNVTATDHQDMRNFSGYGLSHVDLAAPGEDMPLLNLNGGPINDSGTSFAAPIVSGLVALLYSAPCPSIGQRAIADPVAMSNMVRDAILDGVDLRLNLLDEVKTGGRANAFSSLQLLMEKCTRCEPPFGLGLQDLTDESTHIFWTSTDSALSTNLRWKKMADPTWMSADNVGSPYFLENLEACEEYEFQLENMCADTMSGFTPSYFFETDGCCRAPDNVQIMGITTTGALVMWEPVLAAQSYKLTLFDGVNTSQFEGILTTSFVLSGLTPCADYSVILTVNCANGAMDMGSPVFFMTNGCGTCLDASYCPSEGEDATGEWIAEVKLNDLSNASASDGGYADFTHFSTELTTWENYEISITPGFESFEYAEWFVAWIDFDQDGQFDGPGEEVFNSNGTASSTVVGTILVPGDAQPGPTRMRVAMRFNVAPSACDALFNFGEVEDYCINIVPGIEPDCHPPSGLNVAQIGNTFADLGWADAPGALSYEFRIRPLTMPVWTVIATSAQEVTAINLEFCALHQFQVRSVCANEKSLWSPSANFQTGCHVPTREEAGYLKNIEVFPNPFSNALEVRFFHEKMGEVRAQFFDATGRLKFETTAWKGGERQLFLFEFSEDELPPGVYFLKIKSGDGVVAKRVVRQ